MAKRSKGKESAANEAPTSPVKKKNNSSSSYSLLFIVAPLIVALVGGAWMTLIPHQDDVATMTRNLSTTNVMNTTSTELVDKYKSEIVHITTQKLLTPSEDSAKCPEFTIIGDLTHVENVMGTAKQLQEKNQIFVMLNGENEGLLLPWKRTDECLYEMAMFAALTLGADGDRLVNGVKLMSQMGLAITTGEELDKLRIVHVLLDGQIWVWPGIKVGHVQEIEGYKVTTQSMRPKVFTVEGFFTQDEADSIITQGVDRLARSPVDSPEAVDGYHSDRTSDTAFLKDNQFTRDFRVRTAKLARLPSPSFTERMQLVRYQVGQFFRKHEDYFESKQFIPKKALATQEYKTWTKWAAAKIDELGETLNLPQDFRKGGNMYPDFQNKLSFQHGLLQAFIDDMADTDFFQEHADAEWEAWIKLNLKNKASDIIGPLMKDREYMLPYMIKAWEKRIGHPEFQYTIPKRPVSAVSHYFRWIRWVKERTQDLLDTNPTVIPSSFRPEGVDYPNYNVRYQNRLVKYVLEDYSKEQLVEEFGQEWYDWFIQNQRNKDVLLEALRATTRIFDFVVESWTKRAGEAFTYKKPEYLYHFEPNRFVTVFLYLNDCPEGGETVFPYSKERLVTNINREGMSECSDGLAVPPTKLTASMFYSQTPMNDPDPASLHGGCPPSQGVKYGANSFAWNADADEGANAWDLGGDVKPDPEFDV